MPKALLRVGVFAFAGLCFLAGFFMQRLLSPETPASPVATPDPAPRLDLRSPLERERAEARASLDRLPEEGEGSLELPPRRAIAEAMRHPDRLVRLAVLTEAVARMSAAEAEAIAGLLFSQADGPMQRQELGIFLYAWGKLNPVGALERTQAEIRGRDGRYLQSVVMSAWAEDDPLAALEYAQSVDTPGVFDPLLFGAVTGMAASDPAAAANYVALLEDERMASILGRRVFSQLARQDADQLTLLADGFADDDRQSLAYREILEVLGDEDRVSANLFLQQRLEDPAASGVLRDYSRDYGRDDPSAAFLWATSLPAGHQDEAVAGVFESWVRTDLEAAAQHLDRLPAAPENDGPTQIVARAVGESDPFAGAEWAFAITDPEMQAATLEQILSPAVRNDPDGIEEFVARNGEDHPALLEAVGRLVTE